MPWVNGLEVSRLRSLRLKCQRSRQFVQPVAGELCAVTLQGEREVLFHRSSNALTVPGGGRGAFRR